MSPLWHRHGDVEPPRFAVLGNPVAHSWSPWIHARFAMRHGVEIAYRHVELSASLDEEGFTGALDRLWSEEGLSGMNVTVPFKRQAYVYARQQAGFDGESEADGAGAAHLWGVSRVSADLRTQMAQCAQAALETESVNTLMGERCMPAVAGPAHRRCAAFNTDAMALRRVLESIFTVSGSDDLVDVLILGAGATAATVLDSVLQTCPGNTRVRVANRTPERARELTELWREKKGLSRERLRVCSLDALSDKRFSLIINSTSAGHSGEALPLPPGILHPRGVCVDINYGRASDTFGVLSARLGCAPERFYDGLTMLVYQAYYAFSFWHATQLDAGRSGVDPFLSELVGTLRHKIDAGQQPPSECAVVAGNYREFF